VTGVFAPELSLVPLARRPLRLPEQTVRAVLSCPPPTQSASTQSPRSSIVIVTHDNLLFTRFCLATVLANTPSDSEYEVIVVDNASSDGTVEYLRDLSERQARLRLMFNTANRGFAPAVNQGLGLARGDVLVLLNNDTLVPREWLAGLVRHLAEPSVGLVGPSTNSAGNEAQIEIPYGTFGGFELFAADRARTAAGLRFDIPMLTMFCVAMRRDTYERLGPLDERFVVGMFEDDDYSRRARQAGYAVVCAEDVFVHHFGQASFGQLVSSGEYAALFDANRRRFEQKWGAAWEPHRRRLTPAYCSLVERIRRIVDATLPGRATVMVVSRGDDGLLELGGDRRGWHFPRLADGTYAGYYPADSSAAIAHVEELRTAGADHLLFPSTSLWWLEHYPGLRRHLDERYRTLVSDQETCSIYALRPGAGP
jgi:GT2 family glycosyltransferase